MKEENQKEKIRYINKNYQNAKKRCFKPICDGNNANSNMNNHIECMNSFYKELKIKIDNAKQNQAKLKMNKPTAKKIVEQLLESDDFKKDTYRRIYFWVIYSSFQFNDFIKAENSK